MRYPIALLLLLAPTSLQSASVACAVKDGCSLGITITATVVPVSEMTAAFYPEGDNGSGYVVATYREYHTEEMRQEQVLARIEPSMFEGGRQLVARADPDALRVVLEPEPRPADFWSEAVVLAQSGP